MAGKRGFGSIRKLKSGRYQARYTGPNGVAYPHGTYGNTKQAELALSKVRVAIDTGNWLSPEQQAEKDAAEERAQKVRQMTVADAATLWLDTIPSHQHRHHSRFRLHRYILPELGHIPLRLLSREDCDAWYRELCPNHPTQKARTYAALQALLRLALDRGFITAVPLKIRGGGDTVPKREPQTATVEQLGVLMDALPEQDRAAALIAAWCSLRVGEVVGLQRWDVTVDPTPVPYAPTVRLRIRRHIIQNFGRQPDEPTQLVIDGSKADQASASVVVPPHIVPDLWEHLERHTGPERTAWLFPAIKNPSLPLHTAVLHRHWREARSAAGLEHFVFHDLRRTGNTLAAESGATLGEMMQRLRHRSVRSAQVYIMAAHGADVRVAQQMSDRLAPPPRPTSTPAATEPAVETDPEVDPIEAEVQRRLASRLKELGIGE